MSSKNQKSSTPRISSTPKRTRNLTQAINLPQNSQSPRSPPPPIFQRKSLLNITENPTEISILTIDNENDELSEHNWLEKKSSIRMKTDQIESSIKDITDSLNRQKIGENENVSGEVLEVDACGNNEPHNEPHEAINFKEIPIESILSANENETNPQLDQFAVPTVPQNSVCYNEENSIQRPRPHTSGRTNSHKSSHSTSTTTTAINDQIILRQIYKRMIRYREEANYYKAKCDEMMVKQSEMQLQMNFIERSKNLGNF